MLSIQSNKLITQIAQQLLQHDWKLATAESCTAGGLAYALTSLAGSSAWFDRGFVTYSNHSKEELVHVKHETLVQYGAVSSETVSEMAVGALENSQAQISIAITGIAGPDGGTPDKPVGLVWFGIVSINKPVETYRHIFQGDRQDIREQSIDEALTFLLNSLK